MKKILFLSFVFLICNNSFADRIVIEKSTGKLIEYQSGDGPLGALKRNAVNAGYDASDVEERYSNDAEVRSLLDSQVYEPARQARLQRENSIRAKIPGLRTKLGLTPQEFSDLMDIMTLQ